MPTDLTDQSDILLGTRLFLRHVKCGKSRCHCASGSAHPTWYLAFRASDGRGRQITVHLSMISAVHAMLRTGWQEWSILERRSLKTIEKIRNGKTTRTCD